MLKQLKKTWKEEEQRSQSPGHSQEGPYTNDPHSTPPPTLSPDLEHVPGTNIPSKYGNKRSRDIFEPEAQRIPLERPAKATRTDNSDSIRNHLPEIVDSKERDDGPAPISVVELKQKIFEQAKQQNTIAVLPSAKLSLNLLADILSWAVDQERHRPRNFSARSRTALFVVDDVVAIEKYSSMFEAEIPDLAIAKYNADVHPPELQAWVEILKKDLVIISSKHLLDSLIKGALAVTQFHLLLIGEAQSIRNQDCHVSMPIVQVMNDFYRVTGALSRPRIFALASPPPDRGSHFDSKMLKMEQVLDAKVFAVTDEKRAEIMALPDRPDEIVILYDTLQRSTETRLLKQLHKLDPSESVFRQHYLASRYAHDEVGPCASDLIWRRALKEMDGITWFEDSDDDEIGYLSDEGVKMRIRNIVRNWTFTMPNLDASSKGFNVSHKFLRLVQVLSTFKSYGEGFRGIIFVQRRAIALVLAELLRNLDDRIGFLRPQPVIGSGCSSSPNYYQDIFHNFATGVCNLLIATKSMEDLDVPKASVVIRYDLFESQISHAYVRARTRGRESHLIHMAERGNDVHRRILSRITNLDANMLRWTECLCNTPESSVPPGSLRETIDPCHSDSEGEDEESANLQYIKDATTSGRIYLQDATTVLYRYAASIRELVEERPDNRKLFDFEVVDKESGIPRAYICTINFPRAPIHGILGDLSSSKAEARRSACYNACQHLYQSGLLDCRLVPMPSSLRAQHEHERKKHTGKDTGAEVKTGGTRVYPRQQPNFWTTFQKGTPTKLYPTIIYIDATIDKADPYGQLVILTREPLATLLPFRLFSSGIAVQARFQKAAPMIFDEERIKEIHQFTIRICRAVMNKALVCSLEEMAYFLLPLPVDWRPPTEGAMDILDISDNVPWNTVSLAARHWAVAIKNQSADSIEKDLRDAVIQDRWIEFTRRYRVIKVRKDLTPLSKPADSIREAQYDSLWHFCKSKRKGLEDLASYDQPIVEVVKVHGILNHLNPTSKPPTIASKSPAKYLIPELCAKFTVPASTMKTAMLLPSIMRRVDDFLLVKEMDAKFFDHAVNEDLLHNAICTPSAGLEYDYERLELFGDAFLKYLSSVYVFVTNPSLTEGLLHVARQKIISNKSLLYHATRIGLPAYVQSKVFAYKSWQPPNFHVYIPPRATKDDSNEKSTQPKHGDEKNEDRIAIEVVPIQRETAIDLNQTMVEDDDMDNLSPLAMDEVAQPNSNPSLQKSTGENFDPIESNEGIILSMPPEVSTLIDEARGKEYSEQPHGNQGKSMRKKAKPKKKKSASDEQGLQSLGDKAIADVAEAIIGAAYISGGREAALQVTKSLTLPLSHVDRWSDFGRKVLTPPPNFTAKLRPGSIAAIETLIGHKFNRPHLLAQAMTHSSIQGYEITSYERLEFIGDAILDFMVIRHIYDRDQQLSPGALTMLKGAMVSNSALAAVCVWSGLQKYLLSESSHLEHAILNYVNELNLKQEKEYALAEQEGRSPGQYWLDLEPPKALSDVVESVIGAIYISDNFSPVGAESLFDNMLKPFYDKHITLHTLSHHPTKILFELLQAQGCQQFEIIKDKDESTTRCHILVHEVVLASGEDLTPASAARQASLCALDALEGDADFMTRTCDCRVHQVHKKVRKKTEFERALELALSKTSDGIERVPEVQEEEKGPMVQQT